MKNIKCSCTLRAKLNFSSKIIKKKTRYSDKLLNHIFENDFLKNLDKIKEKGIKSCVNTDEICEVFLTPNMGRGVRAKTFIPEKTNIGCYIGELMHNDRNEEEDIWKYSYHYIFKKYFIDGSSGDSITSFLNHSDKPNVTDTFELHEVNDYEEIHITFYTTCDIHQGEELFIDYGDGYWKYSEKQGIRKDSRQRLITEYFPSYYKIYLEVL